VLATLGVELTVLPLQLPDRPPFRMDYLSYAGPLAYLGHGRHTRGRRVQRGHAHARRRRSRTAGLRPGARQPRLPERAALRVSAGHSRSTPIRSRAPARRPDSARSTGSTSALVRCWTAASASTARRRRVHAAVQPELPLHDPSDPRGSSRGSRSPPQSRRPGREAAARGTREHLARPSRSRRWRTWPAKGGRTRRSRSSTTRSRAQQPQPVEPGRARGRARLPRPPVSLHPRALGLRRRGRARRHRRDPRGHRPLGMRRPAHTERHRHRLLQGQGFGRADAARAVASRWWTAGWWATCTPTARRT
jgi:hypothetical protein